MNLNFSHSRVDETLESKRVGFNLFRSNNDKNCSANILLAHEITIFQDRVRVDVQTSTPGLNFFDAWINRQTMEYRGQKFFVASKADLIASKRAAGLEVDLEDVRLLTLDDPDR